MKTPRTPLITVVLAGSLFLLASALPCSTSRKDLPAASDDKDGGLNVKKFGNVLEEPDETPPGNPNLLVPESIVVGTSTLKAVFVDQLRLKPKPVPEGQQQPSDLDLIDEGGEGLTLTELA